MAKDQKHSSTVRTGRAKKAKLSAKESLKRLREFAKRKEDFVATVRKGKG